MSVVKDEPRMFRGFVRFVKTNAGRDLMERVSINNDPMMRL